MSRLEDTMFTGAEFVDDPNRVIDELTQLGQRLESVDQMAKTFSGYQKLFGVQAFEFAELETGKERWDTIKQLWQMVKSWNDKYQFWQESEFTALQVEDIDKEVQVFFKDSYAVNKKLGNKVSEIIKDRIAEFKQVMPNVLDLGNPNMRPRHWDKVFKLIKQNYYPEMPFSLSVLMGGGIMTFKDAIGDISGAASGEAQLEDSLNKIKNGWEKMQFLVMNHRDQHGLYILGPLDEIFTLLEDNQVTLQTMLGSRFIRGIQERVEEWEKKLSSLSETLDEWLVCQRTWMYLENIFGAEDIQKQLPAESQKFLIVDRSWKTIMTRTFSDPLVLSALLPLEK